ncbi:hypothetical protein GIB67_029865 [Kingdonia uniflora]|uniref:HAT C-terminal dimerisation domain-containing protein n=1 Tax=Kingdonia uniflora TaxID=39325 RepID=A0A7J7NJ77_9MAGN|nr:hypothetical protein GIB67_029865 [Kingdonia uniflora]
MSTQYRKRKATSSSQDVSIESPLWKYVVKVPKEGGKGGGSYTRVKGYLLRQTGSGVKVCTGIDDENLKKLTKLQEVADLRLSMVNTGVTDVSLPKFEDYGIKPRREWKKVKEEYGRFAGCMASFSNVESQRDRNTEDGAAWWNNYGASTPLLAKLADRFTPRHVTNLRLSNLPSTLALKNFTGKEMMAVIKEFPT